MAHAVRTAHATVRCKPRRYQRSKHCRYCRGKMCALQGVPYVRRAQILDKALMSGHA